MVVLFTELNFNFRVIAYMQLDSSVSLVSCYFGVFANQTLLQTLNIFDYNVLLYNAVFNVGVDDL